MTPFLAAPLRSLEFRLFVRLAVTAAAVLVLHAAMSYRSTRAHFSALMGAEVERSTNLIKGATHDGMLLNRLDEVQATLQRLSMATEVASIRVFNTRGKIVLSGDVSERGRVVPPDSATCLGCHGENHTPGTSARELRLVTRADDGHEILRRLTVIENEEGCTTATCHFHREDEQVLGLLDVGMSMAPFDAAIHASQRQLVWTTIVLIAICGSVVALFIRRVVHVPVQRLQEGTRRIAAGDLDTQIDVRGEDELARLAGAFNQMAEELSAARREVVDWSETLEQKVEAKTRELQLAERQVVHMETMASLGKLSATVAHELNNPLSAMLTYARLVRRELDEQELGPAAREDINRSLGLMEKECSRCGAIVHNLLTFARRRGADMAPVDLNEIVERSLMLVRHHLEMRSVRLCAERLAGSDELVADGGQLEQAMLALLMNAVEAMPAREGVEAVLTVRLRGGPDGVEIEIGDTGVGIPPEVLPHIFEPFFSTKGGENGVGLGLAVVYGIVNRHGGAIDVRTEVGVGTTFTVRLPRHPPVAVEPAVAGRDGSGASG